MDQTVHMSPKNIAIIFGIIIAVLIVGIFVYKVFKKCSRYCFVNNIRFLNLANIVVFALPFGLLTARIYYKIEILNTYSWILPFVFVVCICFPIIVNVIKMGLFYGLSLSFFRLIISVVGLCLGYGLLAVIALAVILSSAVVENVLEQTEATVITTDGQILNLAKLSNGTYVDICTGKSYMSCGRGVLSCMNDESVLYITGYK